MAGHRTMALVFCFFLMSMLVLNTQARYLPTRSDRDRLDKLRELLRDICMAWRQNLVCGNVRGIHGMCVLCNPVPQSGEYCLTLVESELGRAEYPQEMGSSYRSPNEGKIFFKREISAQD